MNPYLADADVTLYLGDCLSVLRELPDESVHACVTSPPFYGLRDYGTGTWEGGDEGCDHQKVSDKVAAVASSGLEGGKKTTGHIQEGFGAVCGKCGARRVDQQIGLEETPEQWVERLVQVFREVRRVLRKDGSLWLEIGDSYCSEGHNGKDFGDDVDRGRALAGQKWAKRPKHLKQKDLLGQPWMLAFALRADGWYLRSEIIWARPNPMPESVTDRPTKSHSTIFLLTKSPRYYFDQEAVREDYDPQQGGRAVRRYPEGFKEDESGRGRSGRLQGPATVAPPPQEETLGDLPGEAPRGPDGRRNTHVQKADGSIQHRDGERWPNSGRNIRSVWSIATQPFAEAHFATFPEELVRRCILAGTSEKGCCPECGAPWVRETELTPEYKALLESGKAWRTSDGKPDEFTNRQEKGHPANVPPKLTTTGWHPSCECHPFPSRLSREEGQEVERLGFSVDSVSCTVLDPFVGSGTTALVARKLGRRAIGIDLSEPYLQMAARRLGQQSLFALGAS